MQHASRQSAEFFLAWSYMGSCGADSGNPSIEAYIESTNEVWFINNQPNPWVYNFDTKTCRQITTAGSPPSKLHWGHASVVGDIIYHFGGSDSNSGNTYSNQVHTLDTKTHVWQKLTVSLRPPQRFHHDTLHLNQKIYAYGGHNGDVYFRDLWEFDIDSSNWMQLSRPPGNAAMNAEGAILDQFLFFHGGVTTGQNVYNYLIRYDTKHANWTTLSPQSELLPRSGHSMFVDTTQLVLWIVGGWNGTTMSVHHRLRLEASKDMQPAVDQFIGEARCWHGLTVHRPTNTPFCRGTSGMHSLRLECNYFDGCPLLTPPPICPPSDPFRCGSLLCVDNPNTCTNLKKDCWEMGNITCFNGECASRCEDCQAKAKLPCSQSKVMCCDGSCSSTMADCPSVPCSLQLPFRCPNGVCRATAEECPMGPTCEAEQELCEDGVCREAFKCPSSVDLCPISSRLCPDATCAPQGEDCTPSQPYCGADKVKCWDGSCISGECPSLLLSIKVAPLSFYKHPSSSGIQELPLKNWDTDEFFGSIVVDSSQLPDETQLKVSKVDFAKLHQPIFPHSFYNETKLLGPCVEVIFRHNNETVHNETFVQMEGLLNLNMELEFGKQLQAESISFVALNNDDEGWKSLPTAKVETPTSSASRNVELSASSDREGTFCVALLGDPRPFLTLQAPRLFILREASDLTVAVEVSLPPWDPVLVPFQIVGTAVEGEDFTLYSLTPNPVPFSPATTTANLLFFFPGTSSFSGYRSLQIQFGESSPPQLNTRMPVEQSTILLTTTFQHLASESMTVVFPGSSLNYQIIPLDNGNADATDTEEKDVLLEAYQLEVVLVRVVELSANGTELNKMIIPIDAEFEPEVMDERMLILSSSSAVQDLSLEGRFSLGDSRAWNASLFSASIEEHVPDNSTLYIQLVFDHWTFKPETERLELVMELFSQDGRLMVTDQPELRTERHTNSDMVLEERGGEGGWWRTSMATRHTILWVDTPALNGVNEPLSFFADGIRQLMTVKLPLFEERLVFQAAIHLAVNATDEYDDKEESDDVPVAAIAAPAAVGGLLFVFLVVVVAIVLMRMMKKKRKQKKEEMQEAMELEPGLYSTFNTNKHHQKKIRAYSSAKSNKKNGAGSEGGFAIRFKDLEFGEQIGQGSFGVVYRGTWRLTDVAIKMLNNLTEEQLKEFRQEVELMQNLRPHSNVVLLLGVCLEEDHPLCIITELMPKGSLLRFLQSEEGKQLGEKEMVSIARGIAAGMQHLHEEKIIHCDLSARNVLLTETLEGKVADFGMSRVLNAEEDQHKTVSNMGPIRWMAPESLREQVYSTKSDVWAFGVLLWEMASMGQMPYSHLKVTQVSVQVASKGLCLQPPEGTPPIFAELMQQCFQQDPEDRPSFSTLHKLLKKALLDMKS
ncbi:Tyrosine-protein kinase abl1 [Balamuthia mandrillaris]